MKVAYSQMSKLGGMGCVNQMVDNEFQSNDKGSDNPMPMKMVKQTNFKLNLNKGENHE